MMDIETLEGIREKYSNAINALPETAQCHL